MNVEKRKEGHRYSNHVFLGMCLALIYFISLFAGIGIVSATITGTPPNFSGDTNIYTDTNWNTEDITLSGNVVIHPGGSLTLDSTTLIFASTSSVSYGITVKKGGPAGGKLKIINGSNVTAQNPEYNTWIYAEYESPASSKTPVIQASDSYFSELGKGYYGGDEPKRWGLEIRHTTSESYFDNITLTNSYNGVLLGDGGEPINITNSRFDNIVGAAISTKYVGAYIYNNNITNMKVAVYAQYTDGLRIVNNSFDAGTRQAGSYVIDMLGNPVLWERMDRNFLIKDNEFKNFQRGVVCINGVRDGIIEGNIATNATGLAFGTGGTVVNTENTNITIRDNKATNVQDGIIANGREFIIYNNEIINLINPNLISAGLRIEGLHDSVIYNTTIRNVDQPSTTAVRISDTSNVSLTNISISDFECGLKLSNVSDTQFVNLNISNSLAYDIDFNGLNTGLKFINTLFDDSKIVFADNNDLLLPYYYHNVKVVDSNDIPIEGAIVTCDNNIDSRYQAVNVNGENKTSFVTGADGLTSTPSDPKNLIAILDYCRTKTELREMCYTITAEQGNSSNTTTINSDSSWYRSNPNTYPNTVTIVLETGSDTTQPTITNISATDITSSSATITWTTDEPATSQMEYGLTTSYGSSTILDTILVTSHSQTLTGLTPSTTYHYRVKSNDTSNNLAISADYTFLTTEEAEGLVGYWNFDECSEATAYDSSGNGNHGTLVNGPQLVDGKIGGALRFDGTDDYVNCGYDASLDTYAVTLEAWLKFDSFPDNKHFLGKAGRWTFCYSDNKIKMLIWNGPNAASTTVPSLDTWYHVVGTYEGSTVKIYVNGIEENNVSGSSSQCVGYNLTIGFVEVHGDYFNGTIDEVRVYNRVLSADEILAHYQAGLGDDTNTLSGAVTSPDSTGIAGANVTLTTVEGIEINTTQTDFSGNYEFADVPPDFYNLTATKLGYWPDSDPVTVTAEAPETADIVLCQKGDFNINSESADAGDLAMMADATAAGTSDETYDLDGDGNPADEADLTLLKDVSVGVAELE